VRDVFLIGGGRDPEGVRACHAPFVAAANGGPIAVIAQDDRERWETALREAGAREVRHTQPQGVGDAAAVYVAGGLTPAYQEHCVPGDWLPAAVAYGGFSAGAAIAARRALVGGWRVERGGRRIPVCPEDASEDLDLVERRDGLALVPFTIDVHAAQWGTTTRLLHALEPGETGWAIDEHTALHARGHEIVAVHGFGMARRVHAREDGTAEITAVCA